MPAVAHGYFEALHQALENQYAECDCESCQNTRIELSKKDEKNNFEDLLNSFEKAFKKLFEKGSYKPSDLFSVKEYQEVIKHTASVFSSAIPHEVPQEMKAYLEKDAFVFSGLKTHAELTEARSLLKDKDGNIRPYYQFEKEVLKLNEKYNKNYLETEYQFAVNSSQSAANWANLQEDTDRYWLEYRTAGDEKVRQSHANLNGICLPKNDPFWQEFYPPNGWRCRCIAVEVLAREKTLSDSKKAILEGEKATTQISKNGKNKLAMFRFNAGAEQKLFPPNNSYIPKYCKNGKTTLTNAAHIFLSLEDERCKALEIIEKEAERNLFVPKIIKEYENGGKIIVSNLVDANGSDYERVLKCCEFFAKQGKEATILPRFNSPLKSDIYKQLYKELEGTPYWGKCPDFKVDGKFYEHEGFLGNTTEMDFKQAFKKATNMISKGIKQSDKIIIDYTPCDYNSVKRSIEKRISENQKISEVWVLQENELKRIY